MKNLAMKKYISQKVGENVLKSNTDQISFQRFLFDFIKMEPYLNSDK